MVEYKTKEELYATLNRTVANLQANGALKTRIGQGAASLGFVVTDLGAEYGIVLAKDGITGTQGTVAGCSVSLVLKSSVLDGILSGKMDPETAYTYGSLTLRGSEYEAEGLLRFWRDIVGAYLAACA